MSARYHGVHLKVAEFMETFELEPRANEEEEADDGSGEIISEPHMNLHVDYGLRQRFKVHLAKVVMAIRAIENNDSDTSDDSSEMEAIVRCLHGTGDFDADELREKIKIQDIALSLAVTQIGTMERQLGEKKADLVLAHMQVERMERQIIELQGKEP